MNASLLSSAMLVIKILIVSGLILYTGFAFIVVRQEQLMSNVLEEHFETILRLLAVLHLLAAIFTIILAMVLL